MKNNNEEVIVFIAGPNCSKADLRANSGLKFHLVFFFFFNKTFCKKHFLSFFRVSNHQCVETKNLTKFSINLSFHI